MRNLSSEFIEQQNNGNRNYLKYADVTFSDGKTISLTNEDFWSNGMRFEDSVSGSSSFDIGSAIINSLTLSINNFSGKFTDYIWDDARVVCYVGMQLSTGIEKIRICTMTVVDAPYQSTAVINLTCEDYMRKFDRDYSESKLIYPATRLQIIQDACDVCGVTLQSTSFENDDFVIEERPDDNSITFRQVIAWAAQMGCQWARADEYGRLCLGWYEKTISKMDPDITAKSSSGFTPWLYDVTITGVRVTEYIGNSEEEPESFEAGSAGYVIEISDNKLVQKGKGKEICEIISSRCTGMKFRPFTTESLTNIAWEAGDSIVISDRNGEVYKSYLTSVSLNPGSFERLECGAESVSRKSQKQYTLGQQIKAETKTDLKKERTAREKALKDLAERLSESSGVYTTIEEQEDGSNIFYLHNKPKLEDSSMVWKMTAEAWAVSTDGGKTWNGGMTVDADIIARILNASGINADWINTGTIKGTDEDGNIKFLFDVKTGKCIINLDELQIQGKDITTVTEEKTNAQINKFIKDTYAPSLNNLQSQLDGKIETWHQDTDPSLEWSSVQNTPWKDKDGNPILDMDGNPILMDWEDIKALHEGDLWYNTSNNTQWIYQSGVWVPQDIPNSVLDIINGKSSIYVTRPTPPYEKGDLWLTSLNNGEAALKTSILTRTSGEFVESDWIDFRYVDSDDIKDAINNFNNSLGFEEIFKKLSNNGAVKGIWIKDGQLYFSFTYAQGGILKLGGVNNGNGLLSLYSKDGNEVARLENRGLFIGWDLNDTNVAFAKPDENGYELYEWCKEGDNLITGSKNVGMRWNLGQEDNKYSLQMMADDEFEVVLNDGVDSYSNPYTPFKCERDYSYIFNQLKLDNVHENTNAYTLMLTTDGTVTRAASSSERYKDIRENISELETKKWYGIQPVWAKYKDGYLSENDENNGKYIPMFVAEDVEKYIPEAVVHMNGKTEDWNYRIMIPAMFAMIKQQHKEIEELKKKVR